MDLITTHTGADFDTIGAMLAAKKLYPDARLAFPGSLEKELENALKTLELPFKIEPATAIKIEDITRLIIVDTRSPLRIGRFREALGKEGLVVHTYDHHPDQSGDVRSGGGVVKPYGSTTTILALILKERGIRLTPQEATIMMAGIYEDTGSLCYGSTRVEDFDAARYLLENGAVLNEVARLLSHELTASEVSALHDLIESEASYVVGGARVTIAVISVEDHSIEVAELARRLIKIEQMPCLILLAQSTDRVHFVIRSSSPQIDAGLIAAKLGGGGHAAAASATVKGLTLIQAKERVLMHLKDATSPDIKACDIMSTPPITIDSTANLKEAALKMRRFNINALPVMSKDAFLKGVITRQVADKAIGHGLGKEPAIDYVSSELLTIEASCSVDEVRSLVPELGQRLLPVTDKGRLAGVITRTDLIKILRQGLSETRSDGVKKKRVITSLMRQQLPAWAFALLKDAGKVASELGCEAYGVGGFVRDLIMRRDNLDIDIVVEGDGLRFAKKFARSLKAKVKIHERFKTATITCKDGLKVDVATARLEYYVKPGALPTIEQSSLKLDLYRRDFTINTLALRLNPEKFGEVLDFFGAQRDIKERTIRVLHNLSFVEDPTRAMRAVRFSERFDFKIAPHTENLLKNSVKLGLLTKSSAPRVREELINILKEDMALHAIGRLKDLSVLPLIDAKIRWDEKAERLFENARGAVAWYELLYREEKITSWLVLILALTDNLKKRELSAFSRRLSIDNKKNLATIEDKGLALKALRSISATTQPSASRVYSLLKPLALELTLYLIAKADKPEVKKLISRFVTELKDKKPGLKGKDLLLLGVKEGPEVGEVLEKLLMATLDNKVASLSEERKFVKELIK
ncbi:tRNA nucleotidyltransferase, A-adding [hydrothermal vent metagenome]|uniref:tRNA nucleotidyltransferase, A-adding n=1 Tax=hydrothermal vent metagenome TaxID=652676 RepID=A0A3B0R8I7_9ZZZZ